MPGIEKPILLDLPVPIRTKRLVISPCQEGDGPERFAAISESIPEISRYFPWVSSSTTPGECEENMRSLAADFILRKNLVFKILHDSSLVGFISICDINWKIPAADIGYWLRTPRVGRGYITEAANAIALYAFRVIGTRRLILRCHESNHKSAAVAKRLGFALESTAPMADVNPLTGEPVTEFIFVRFNDQGLDDTETTWGKAAP